MGVKLIDPTTVLWADAATYGMIPAGIAEYSDGRVVHAEIIHQLS
jgi:hypothetical protein